MSFLTLNDICLRQVGMTGSCVLIEYVVSNRQDMMKHTCIHGGLVKRL